MRRDIETRIDIYLQPTFTNFALNAIGKHTVTHDYYVECNKRHDGNFILFQLTLEGHCLFKQEGKIYRCPKDTMFICHIPSDAVYYLPKYSELYKPIYLEISEEFLPGFNKLIELNNGLPIIDLTKYPYIITLLQEIYSLSLIDTDKSKLEKLSFDFITELFDIFKPEDKYPPKVHSIKKYIESNYSKNISLDDISRDLYISKYYMIKKFKEQTNLTPMQFLTEYRLKVARTLLLNSENSISYIASQIGFNDSNYFSKVFKKKYNINPKDYRFIKR